MKRILVSALLIAFMAMAQTVCAFDALTDTKVDAKSIHKKNVADYFGVSAADDVFLLTPLVARLDMIDYFKSGMNNTVDNRAGGKSHLISLTDTILSMKYNSEITVDVVLLPGKNPVLMTIETLPLPQHDSRIKFYDASWKPLGDKVFQAPGLDRWLTPQGRAHRKDVEQAIPFMLYTASYDAVTQTLTVKSNIESYFAVEKPAELEYLLPSLSYKWDGRRFKPMNK